MLPNKVIFIPINIILKPDISFFNDKIIRLATKHNKTKTKNSITAIFIFSLLIQKILLLFIR